MKDGPTREKPPRPLMKTLDQADLGVPGAVRSRGVRRPGENLARLRREYAGDGPRSRVPRTLTRHASGKAPRERHEVRLPGEPRGRPKSEARIRHLRRRAEIHRVRSFAQSPQDRRGVHGQTLCRYLDHPSFHLPGGRARENPPTQNLARERGMLPVHALNQTHDRRTRLASAPRMEREKNPPPILHARDFDLAKIRLNAHLTPICRVIRRFKRQIVTSHGLARSWVTTERRKTAVFRLARRLL